MDSGEAAVTGFGHQEVEFVGGLGVGQTFRADIGDAVAFGVGAAGLGVVGEVDAEAVGGGEAGALSDEDDG